MADDVLEIDYQLTTEDGTCHHFKVELDARTVAQTHAVPDHLPDWVALPTEQCAGCPLRVEEHPYCPAARSLATLLPGAETLISFDTVDAVVRIGDRRISATVPMQSAMSSLVGLCMATSGCPSLAFLKPMARFHVPFATMQETVFRATSSYLLGQYFRKTRTDDVEITLDGLDDAYRRLHLVNVGMARRLRHIAQGDANLNAIVKLDLFTHEMPFAIREELNELAPYFDAYWKCENSDD